MSGCSFWYVTMFVMLRRLESFDVWYVLMFDMCWCLDILMFGMFRRLNVLMFGMFWVWYVPMFACPEVWNVLMFGMIWRLECYKVWNFSIFWNLVSPVWLMCCPHDLLTIMFWYFITPAKFLYLLCPVVWFVLMSAMSCCLICLNVSYVTFLGTLWLYSFVCLGAPMSY